MYDRSTPPSPFIFGPNPQHPLNRGCKLWCLVTPRDFGGSILSDQFGLWHGTLTNFTAQAWWGSILRWGAMQFDGTDDYILLPNTAGVVSGVTFTWSGWIRTGASPLGRTFIGEAKSSTGNTIFQITQDQTTGSKIEVYWRADAGGGASADLVGTITVNDNKWHNVAVTGDGTTMSLYVDGRPDGTANVSGVGTTTPDRITLGTLAYAGDPLAGFQWGGLLDDVRAYTRCLSGREIQALYLESQAGYPEAMLYWQPYKSSLIPAVPAQDPIFPWPISVSVP